MTIGITDAVGLAGFGLYLGSYLLLNVGRLTGQGFGYPAMNLVAAVCVLVSLAEAFNLASALIQCCWIAISLFGLARLRRSRFPGAE